MTDTITRTSTVTRAILAIAVMLLATVGAASAQTPAVDGARFSTSAEYLLWWAKDSPAPPPLLSTGVLGESDFSAVLGGRAGDLGLQQGGRFTASYRLTPAFTIEGIGFFLPKTSVTKTVTSSGEPGSVRLVVPQFRVDEGREFRLTIANPGEYYGAARESLSSGMDGAELNVARKIATGAGWRIDVLGGFRYLRLREELSFSASSVAVDVPDVFMPADVFGVDNKFYGAQLGLKADYAWGAWFAQGVAKVALGVMRESIDVSGSLLTNDFNDLGTPQVFAGGLFALPTNIGHHRRDRFAVVPEVGLKAGYRLTSWASVFVGYTFLYASAVVRPGNQVDRAVNTTQATTFQDPASPPPTLVLQGEARPAVRFRESDFWVQGLSAGISFSI
jgi:putative beta barrel porin BBP7